MSTVITLPHNNTNCLDGSGICNDNLLKDIYKRVMGSKDAGNRSSVNTSNSSSGGSNSDSKCIPCELLREKIIHTGHESHRGGHDDPNHNHHHDHHKVQRKKGRSREETGRGSQRRRRRI
jgi:hypothetical protein